MSRFSRFFEPPEPLSILEQVNSGTLNLRLAAILWMMMEQRSSVVVSAGPGFAGKTTTLNALMNLLPPNMKKVYLHGDYCDFSFAESAGPEEVYMVAEEFNTYMDYVWGDAAINAFDLLGKGYSMGGTIHARTAQEVVYIFNRYLGLSMPVISNIDAVVNLRVSWDRSRLEPLRQIESVCLLFPEDEALSLEVVAMREAGANKIEFTDNQRLRQAFLSKYGADYPDIGYEIEIREKMLEQLMIDMKTSHVDVREAIIEFYRARHP